MKWGVHKAWYARLLKNINSEVNLRRNMCEFCEDITTNNDEYMKKRYAGGDFICKDENGFGVLIDTGDSGCLGYIKINYCPMCGRKLVQ